MTDNMYAVALSHAVTYDKYKIAVYLLKNHKFGKKYINRLIQATNKKFMLNILSKY
jgi:hypothetical protein